MAQTLGIIDITWKGLNMQVVSKGAKLKLGGIRNNTVNFGRTTARAQEYANSEVTATVHLRKGQSYGSIFNVEEGELQVICDTGQTFVFPEAFLTDEHPDITSGEGGEISLKWAAGLWQEIIA